MQYTIRDGVRLAYEVSGSGRPIVLVHGMRCDHGHMQPLFDHLAVSHRVATVDLRGHGASDAPQSAYSNDEMADDIAHVAAHLGMVRPVVIGHSFGGSLALHLATARPEPVGGLVLLDSGVRTAAEKEAEMGGVIDAGDDASPDAGVAFLADRLFGPDDDPEVKASILAAMGSTPAHAASAMARTVLGFDAAAAAIRCAVPALFVLADRPFTTPETTATLGANWRVGQVVGAGHFVQLFAAAQVNAMVDRFLELLPRE